MNTSLPRLTPAEFDVMDAVWNAPETTITEVMKAVNRGKSKPLKRATVQVQLRRLEEKGWLRHREEGNKFFYSATEGRREASAAIAEDIRTRVFGGSCADLVRALFQNKDISRDEIEELKELIAKHDEEG